MFQTSEGLFSGGCFGSVTWWLRTQAATLGSILRPSADSLMESNRGLSTLEPPRHMVGGALAVEEVRRGCDDRGGRWVTRGVMGGGVNSWGGGVGGGQGHWMWGASDPAHLHSCLPLKTLCWSRQCVKWKKICQLQLIRSVEFILFLSSCSL